MKKSRLAALLVAFIMCLTSLGALAYEPWVENGTIRITPVTAADGSELETVCAGEIISLKTTVKLGDDAEGEQTAQLLVVSYKNGFVNGTLPGTKITVTETEQPLTVEGFEVPEDADALKIFVLDGRDTRRPLAQMGVVGADAEVTDIKIDGESIENFSANVTEYDVALSAAYIGTPEIVVNTSDILAKTEITRSEELPAQSWSETISVTKNGESAASYTINFTQEAPAITNALLYQWKTNSVDNTEEQAVTAEETDGFALVELAEPTYNGELTGADYDEGGITEKPDSYVKLEQANDYMLYDIPEAFLGGILFQQKNVRGSNSNRVYSTYSMKEKGVISSIDDKVPDTYAAYSFDINRSATIYVYNATNSSSTAVNETGFADAGYTKDETLALKYYNFKETSLDSFSRASNWYKKHVDVAVDSKVNVKVPVGGFPLYVIVKFD